MRLHLHTYFIITIIMILIIINIIIIIAILSLSLVPGSWLAWLPAVRVRARAVDPPHLSCVLACGGTRVHQLALALFTFLILLVYSLVVVLME